MVYIAPAVLNQLCERFNFRDVLTKAIGLVVAKRVRELPFNRSIQGALPIDWESIREGLVEAMIEKLEPELIAEEIFVRAMNWEGERN